MWSFGAGPGRCACLLCQGAVVGSVAGSALDTGVDLMSLGPINDFWEDTRGVYRPFESGQLTGSADVYDHEVRRQLPSWLRVQAHVSVVKRGGRGCFKLRIRILQPTCAACKQCCLPVGAPPYRCRVGSTRICCSSPSSWD